MQLAAYRISGHEEAAPLFTVIVGPSAEAKSFRKEKKDLAERRADETLINFSAVTLLRDVAAGGF